MKIKKGFTLVELLVVIIIIATLAGGLIIYLSRAREQAKYVRAKKELETIAAALESYLNDNEQYPADVNRGLPNGIEQYLPDNFWPQGPWQGSVYDWDNWNINNDQIYQVSLRPCGNDADPEDCPTWPIFPSFDKWSAIYYCIEGSCRAHASYPINHPGFCVNCNLDESEYLWQ